MLVIHVIPVPRGYQPLDAWHEIQVFGEFRCSWWRRLFRKWATIEVDE